MPIPATSASVDTLHKDPYRARAGAINLIPSSTGAAKAVGLVLPELKGKLDGASIRVPVPNVSLVDLTFQAARPTTVEEINQAVTKAANGPLKGVLGVNAKPLVSIGFQPRSVELDLRSRPAPMWLTARSAASSPGTTTNGASPTACPTRRSPWGGCYERGGFARRLETEGRRKSRPLPHQDHRGDRCAGASACSSASISTCRSRTAPSPTRRGSSGCFQPSPRLAQAGAKVVVLSHLGRPKEGPSSDTSLRPVALKMRELHAGHQGPLHRRLRRRRGEARAGGAQAGRGGRARERALLSRARKRTTRNSPRRLAEHGDLYVNDAFSTRPQGACLDRGHRRSSARTMPVS